MEIIGGSEGLTLKTQPKRSIIGIPLKLLLLSKDSHIPKIGIFHSYFFFWGEQIEILCRKNQNNKKPGEEPTLVIKNHNTTK